MPSSRPDQAKAVRRQADRRTVSPRSPPRAAIDFPIVGIGASAGGLEACTKLLDALPPSPGMAFVLIQHLDPTHESMMVELLAGHTALVVLQATDGMPIERNHVYIIPPGTYLAVGNGALHLTPPQARHGARLPFDFLLHSLAQGYGARAACVVLSGTGADGSLGLKAIKEKSGLVIAQEPNEAGYDGMPRNAIMTGAVDLVLPAADIPAALIEHHRRMAAPGVDGPPPPQGAARDWLPEILGLVHAQTVHDFTPYKPGTLQRRIERRMAMASIGADKMGHYLAMLQGNPGELDCLAKDLLINVTSFFRDTKVFDLLAEQVIPDLVRSRAPDGGLRLWITGCSTGEEAYSLAMLFREQIAAAKCGIKLQVFASDVDPDAVAIAREGLYPETIAADVSQDRLARFFTRDDHGYRVSSELRAAVVFTVQDLLTDPPFSRLDFISCRNLLIYLGPDAQAKAVALFHFALKQGGILLLGSAETVGEADDRFEIISKPERLYRHVGRKRPGDFSFAAAAGDEPRAARPGRKEAPSRQAVLAELCRKQVLDLHAPAAVLCNARHECLYSLGPTDSYLRMAPGHSTPDLVAMARGTLRTRLRSALGRAVQEGARVVVPGGRTLRDGHPVPFNIDVQPMQSEGEALLLVCFVDALAGPQERRSAAGAQDASRIAELEQELDAARVELEEGARILEASSEEQRAINEEALSVNEEYQSTNEELLTSKEELQSLNEELTALNSQLQETLEQQRTTSNDLQNILYSTDVATLFLDRELNIRFFTPATRALFNVIPGDVGRPLADLHSLAADTALPADARAVLHSLELIEREIETPGGTWFRRRILPYRTEGNGIEGVVITFNDITRRRGEARALEAAKQQSELANRAKSRFLAAASHDLRQPLQTLALLQGLLTKTKQADASADLVAKLGTTLGAMSAMLNTLLDVNQIEAGVVHAEMADFRIDDLLDRMRDEYTYHAQAQGLDFRVVPCSLTVHSDPSLLEQMLRNLISNALKYTKQGKVLLGCRRHGGVLSIEVWDTGVGIPDGELAAIFEEYHQLDNAARERSRGLGLGLSIVQRLGGLLDHRVRVRSRRGKGSVFTIEVGLPPSGTTPHLERHRGRIEDAMAKAPRRTGAVLVIEDDPELRDLLALSLTADGHRTTAVPDGPAALDLAAEGIIEPDLVLADYNLPNGMDGLEVSTKLRRKLQREVPVIILTGDISTDTLSAIAGQNCRQLSKPVQLAELTEAVQALLPPAQPAVHLVPTHPAGTAPTMDARVIYVVDDDSNIRHAIRAVLENAGRTVEDYAASEAFLEAYRPGCEGCLLVDAYLPGMGGIELLQQLRERGDWLPAIMITGSSDVPMAVQAMKAGAMDFIEKPIGAPELIASVERALEQARDAGKHTAWRESATKHVAGLTPRQHEIMALVLAGHPSKNIAADLGVSQRTVENHRASIMRKTGARSLPALARLALAAAGDTADGLTEADAAQLVPRSAAE